MTRPHRDCIGPSIKPQIDPAKTLPSDSMFMAGGSIASEDLTQPVELVIAQ
jgi:hypothetical protein